MVLSLTKNTERDEFEIIKWKQDILWAGETRGQRLGNNITVDVADVIKRSCNIQNSAVLLIQLY